MTTHRPFHLFGILLLGCAASRTSSAGTLLYNNISDTPTSANQITEAEYQSFTSGSTSLLMDDLKLNIVLGAPDSGTFNIGLYSDLSTKPDTLLLAIATESDSSLTLSNAIYDFSVADFALTANTQYWIGLNPNPGTVNAKWLSAPVQVGDTGTSGQSIDLGGTVFPSNQNFAFEMTIDAVVPQQGSAPEPSSGLLLAAGLAVAWWARRTGVSILTK